MADPQGAGDLADDEERKIAKLEQGIDEARRELEDTSEADLDG